jgi:hypothetical protein
MKKLIAIFLCIALFIAFAACANSPSNTEVIATPTAKNLFPTEKPTPTPTPLITPTEKREAVNIDGKPVLYVGSFSSGSFEIEDSFIWLDTAVRNFNYRSQDFEARIIDYGNSSAPDAMYRLNTEITSGKMPDILLTHGMPVDSYAKLGLLYDMSGWLKPEEFYTGPLNAMLTADGKLYEISPLITVTSFYGLTKYVGTEGALTLSDIYAAWENFNASGDKVFIAGLSNELICLLLVSAYEEQFVDRSALTCNFTSPKFIELLEFCKNLPAQPAELDVKANIGWTGNAVLLQTPDLHRAVAVRKEEALLGIFGTQRTTGFHGATHYIQTLALDGMDYRFIGYPGANAASIYSEFPLAVSSKSANTDGAQMFVNGLWEAFANELPIIPLKRSAMEKTNEHWLKDWIEFENNKTVLFKGGIIVDNSPDYTMEQFSELEAIIDAANVRVRSPIASYLPPFNRNNWSSSRQRTAPPAKTLADPILAEEIQSYFGGIQDVNRTAELIQSRYSVYLNEQK